MPSAKVEKEKSRRNLFNFDTNDFYFDGLKNQSFFQYFTDNDWNYFKDKVIEYYLKGDEHIVIEGETKDNVQGIYFVAEGQISVSRSSINGRNHYIRILDKGEIFFNPGLFDGGPSPATLMAVGDARVFYIPRLAVVPILIQNSRATEAAFEALAEVIRQAISVIDGLAFKDNASRLATLLLEVSDKDIVKRDQFSLQFLSCCINTVPEVVSRELHKLADEGLIEISRNYLKIINREGLKAIAEN